MPGLDFNKLLVEMLGTARKVGAKRLVVDSIPAILAITQDRFIVITSNVFAVLGLQAMFFAFSKMADYFHYLKHGVALVLAFIGIKMLTADFFHVPPVVSLGVVVGIITAAIVLSAWMRRRQGA